MPRVRRTPRRDRDHGPAPLIFVPEITIHTRAVVLNNDTLRQTRATNLPINCRLPKLLQLHQSRFTSHSLRVAAPHNYPAHGGLAPPKTHAPLPTIQLPDPDSPAPPIKGQRWGRPGDRYTVPLLPDGKLRTRRRQSDRLSLSREPEDVKRPAVKFKHIQTNPDV